MSSFLKKKEKNLLLYFSYFRLKIITFEQDVELGDKDRERVKAKFPSPFFYILTYVYIHTVKPKVRKRGARVQGKTQTNLQ